MNTLIIYGTKHGTAEKCASILSKKLTGKVDVHHLKAGTTPDLSKYDKVIIGGSIYAGSIQKEISLFCTQHLNTLKDKKLGLYICCMFRNEAEAQLKRVYPQELLANAIVKDSFGGEMRFSDMNFAEKFITRMVTKMAAKTDPNLPVLDPKKDTSMICQEAIDEFAERMNQI